MDGEHSQSATLHPSASTVALPPPLSPLSRPSAVLPLSARR